MKDIKEVINNMLKITLKEAVKDKGLWSDGEYIYFRQLKLCKNNNSDEEVGRR